MEKTPTTDLTTTKNSAVFKKITMHQAKKLANELTNFLKQNNLIVNIAGKYYVPVEGWQFVGAQSGLTEVVVSCEAVAPFEDTKEVKYKAVVEVVNQNGTVISRGFAWCSNKENKKKGFEEYAIASMAQTRAVGKAYRNILSWIVKMAGYEAMPAEEADKEALETNLAKAKQNVLKALNENSIVKGSDVMDYIEKTIGKRVIENIDEANEIIRSLENAADESAE